MHANVIAVFAIFAMKSGQFVIVSSVHTMCWLYLQSFDGIIRSWLCNHRRHYYQTVELHTLFTRSQEPFLPFMDMSTESQL